MSMRRAVDFYIVTKSDTDEEALRIGEKFIELMIEVHWPDLRALGITDIDFDDRGDGPIITVMDGIDAPA